MCDIKFVNYYGKYNISDLLKLIDTKYEDFDDIINRCSINMYNRFQESEKHKMYVNSEPYKIIFKQVENNKFVIIIFHLGKREIEYYNSAGKITIDCN